MNTSQFTQELGSIYNNHVQIHLDFNIEHTVLADCFLKKKYSPARDVMDFLNIQDGEWLVSLSFNISETKHVIKMITTDII